MEYYIFAGKTPRIKLSKKDAIFSTKNIYEATRKLSDLSKDIDFVSKYEYAYLILHLGMPVSGMGTRRNVTLHVDIKDKEVPFLIIQKYYYTTKPVIEDICNSITIDIDGFREEFNNNRYASDKFFQYYSNLESATMILNYNIDDQEDSLVIGKTIQIIKCESANMRTNYTFDIDDPNWKNGKISDFDRISLSNLSEIREQL